MPLSAVGRFILFENREFSDMTSDVRQKILSAANALIQQKHMCRTEALMSVWPQKFLYLSLFPHG